MKVHSRERWLTGCRPRKDGDAGAMTSQLTDTFAVEKVPKSDAAVFTASRDVISIRMELANGDV